ncbi:MAG: HNH endonuclease [Bdellovibrionales bacterium]
MTQISSFSNHQLLEVLLTKTQAERNLNLEIIELLEEVDRRKLHLTKGYGSLMEFCVKELKYSESAAYRRISAMRVTRELPQVKKSLAEGSLNLVTVTKAQTFLNQEKKYQNKTYDKAEKLELFKNLENKSGRECEKILVEKSPTLPPIEKIRMLVDDKTQVTVVLEKKVTEKLEELKKLYSHIHPHPSFAELIDLMATDALKKRNTLKKAAAFSQRNVSSVGEETLRKRTRHIPSKIKREVWVRDQAKCTYDHAGKKCDSKFQVEIDHIQPYSLGGLHSPENLRLLCRNHNQLRIREL